MALDGAQVEGVDPDDWCQGPPSPGEWNPTCAGASVDPPTPGPDAGPRPAEVGDLLITEILARSEGVDQDCEWFELANLSDDTLELDLVLTDHGLQEHPLTGTLAPLEVAQVGRSDTCGFTPDLLAEFSLADGTTVLTQDTPDAADRFREAVAVGVDSFGLEMGLEASALVFQEPYYSRYNGSFMDSTSSTLTWASTARTARAPRTAPAATAGPTTAAPRARRATTARRASAARTSSPAKASA